MNWIDDEMKVKGRKMFNLLRSVLVYIPYILLILSSPSS